MVCGRTNSTPCSFVILTTALLECPTLIDEEHLKKIQTVKDPRSSSNEGIDCGKKNTPHTSCFVRLTTMYTRRDGLNGENQSSSSRLSVLKVQANTLLFAAASVFNRNVSNCAR